MALLERLLDGASQADYIGVFYGGNGTQLGYQLAAWFFQYVFAAAAAKLDYGPHGVVMDAADRNLAVVMLQEKQGVDEIAATMCKLAACLEHLHVVGQRIHGDFKPLNAMRMETGEWKLRAEAEYVFRLADKDGNGTLDATELGAEGEGLQAEVAPPRDESLAQQSVQHAAEVR